MRHSAPGRNRQLPTNGEVRRGIFLSLLLLGIVLAAAAVAPAQTSPGPLSKAHASLDSPAQCAGCHAFGSLTPTFKCLDCHKEVADDISGKHGYHFQLKMGNPNGKDCVGCHLEHNGETYNLIQWPDSLQKFDHLLAGYKLEGKHSALACQQCHTPAHMAPAQRERIKIKDLGKSFFGQSTSCTPCHSDPHNTRLGNTCTNCHNMESWRSAAAFDHSRTRFALTGLHATVACEACHKPETAGGPARFGNLKFDRCAACHGDPHKGAFAKTCESCHTTGGWQKLSPAFTFDHSKTKFPLRGQHLQVACIACHSNGDFKRPLPVQNCSGCHKPDPHQGQFAARPGKGECSECHTAGGWKPSLFGVKEHESSEYPLRAKHALLPCGSCHIPRGKDTLYRMKFAACGDCHKDPHAGQFAAYANRCESCHTVADFHRTTFTIAQHEKSRFALGGAHVAVPCADCHKAGAAGRNDRILPFQFEDRSCKACHADPHKGEFNERMARRRADGTASGCEACHTTKSWAEINGFDHAKTRFPLQGAHRTVACAACHPATTAYGSRFAGTSGKCESCHNDVHGKQFTENDGSTHCAECHSSQRWAPSTFDHEARTHFSLTGGHASVACATCHTRTRTVDERTIVIYKELSSKCANCHGNRPKTPSPQPGS